VVFSALSAAGVYPSRALSGFDFGFLRAFSGRSLPVSGASAVSLFFPVWFGYAGLGGGGRIQPRSSARRRSADGLPL